jgi:transmembrane sensor
VIPMNRKAPNMNSRETSSDVEQAAAEWLMRRDRGLTSDQSAAFEHWRSADVRHAAEYSRIAGNWRQLDALTSVSSLAAETDAIVQRARLRRKRQRTIQWGFGALAAAAVLMFVFVIGSRGPALTEPSYQVIASSSRSQTLPDGSVALLNGTSRIQIEFTTAERRVRLLEGEALFTVAKNPDRPFLVTAGTITVRAVGTAFNVKLAAASVEVLVTEGKVRVNDAAKGTSVLPPDSTQSAAAPNVDAAPVLTAGHRVLIAFDAGRAAVVEANVSTLALHEIEQTLAWQTTRLVFNDTSLDEVVAAFNHHNSHRLVLGVEALRSRKITGVFRADNLDGFTRLLEAGVDVKAEAHGPNETVLQPAR